MFQATPSGLLVPTGLVLGNSLVPFGAGPTEDDHRVVRALGAVPTYEDLWDGDRPGLDELIGQVPAQLWVRFLSVLATLLSRENVDQTTKYAIFREVLQPQQRERLERFLTSTHTAFPITEFPVLLLMEVAAARAEVSATPPERIEPESLERMVRAIYVVWSHLVASTDERIREDPAGIAAALNERSLMGSPIRRVLTGFGLWAWEHGDLDESARAARGAFDEHLRSVYSLSLVEWVTGIALATFISQNQPPEEVVTSPIFITPGRPDLTSHGHDLLSRCMERLSTTTEDLRQACLELDEDADLLTEPSLLALKRTPCLRTLGAPPAFRPISPVHLAEAAVERPLVERSLPAESRAAARTEYGSVVEGYVHGLLRGLFGDRYQRLPPIQGRKRAEGVIWFPNGFLVVECKARRASELIRYHAREDGGYFEELVRSGLKTAVEQVLATTEDVLSGDIPFPGPLAPAIAGSLVVFLQDLALSPVSRSVLDRILPRSRTTEGVAHLRPQLISLERLEELDKWFDLDLLAELRAKMSDDDVSLECLNNYLLHEGQTPSTSAVRDQIWQSLRQHLRPCLTE